jgi:hypothetical protein
MYQSVKINGNEMKLIFMGLSSGSLSVFELKNSNECIELEILKLHTAVKTKIFKLANK